MENTLSNGIKEVYNSVIEDTIRECSHLQSSRVLEALRIRWKQALNDRLDAAEKLRISKSMQQLDDYHKELYPLNQKESAQLEDPMKLDSSNHPHTEHDNRETQDEDEFEGADVVIAAVCNDTQGSSEKIQSDSDISDLDDSEPDAKDLIVAQFENVTRPGSKKTVTSNKWRITLRNGIMQIDGHEILFDKLTGEFSFK